MSGGRFGLPLTLGALIKLSLRKISMANDSGEVWPLADFSLQRERPEKDA